MLISYPENITSAIRCIPHGSDVPVPLPSTESPFISLESSDSQHPLVLGSHTECKPSGSDSPQPFSQVELNDLTRDLDLSREAAEILGS